MANNQKIADKKKVDYQEGLVKSHADTAARSRDSYMKDLEKSHHAQSHQSYIKDPEKSRADSGARSHKSYMKVRKRVVLTVEHKATKVNKKDLEKSR